MIRIITDSASDILPGEAQALGITVVPLNVTLEDGTVARDGIDLGLDDFYAHMASCSKLPTTSQPSPEQLAELFREADEAGDETVGIFVSGQLSGTYQCALLAANLAEYDDAYLIDSETVCVAQGLLVRLAAQLRDEGCSAAEIVSSIQQAKQHLHLIAVIDNLKYLRKGGRLPAAVAVAGGMLGIKPLITIKNGKVAMAGKARGLPGAYVQLFKYIDAAGGIDRSRPNCVAYSAAQREIEPILSYMNSTLHMSPALIARIGCVIGTHAGPGAFGIAFFDAKEDEEQEEYDD